MLKIKMRGFLQIALFLLSISFTNAYFYVPNFMSNLPFQGGMATAQRNNTLLMFGGENATNRFTNNLYQLSLISDIFQWQVLEQRNPPPGTLNGQAVVVNNNSNMYLLGGMTNKTVDQLAPFQSYRFAFDTNTWTAAAANNANPSSNTTILANRMLFSATYNGLNKIYIYGGAINDTHVLSDFYVMDTITGQFTKLPDVGIPRYGHTASYLSNGQIVVIGGVAVLTENGKTGNMLAPMSNIFVFDTKTNQWDMKKAISDTSTRMPSTRTSHNAVVTSDDRIIVFGGDNGDSERQRAYLNVVGILDTKTWTWSSPSITGVPPSRRSYASAGLLDGKNLIVAFGSARSAYYNDINVLNIDSLAWLQTFASTNGNTGNSGLSAGIIAGVAIASVALFVIFVFMIWKFQRYTRWFVQRVHHDIWKPRSGEPIWAETTRIVFQIFLLFIFSVFLGFVICQSIKSPNVTQTIEKPTASVQVPDVRFCYDGFPQYTSSDLRAPFVSCNTDNGYSCTQFIRPLDMSIFQPVYADNLGPVNCFLFRAPTDFVLTSTSGSNNGSRLLFTFFGDKTISYGRIHASVYPKQMNPNVPIYSFTDDIPHLMSERDVMNWQTSERNDLQATNVFTMKPSTYSTLAYDLIDHQYLQDVGWNYVGFLPMSNSTPEIETYFRHGAPNPQYVETHGDIGIMALFPHAYVETIQKEVKMYTLLNALGFVGGIFGLLVAVQAWLFGYRPRSPWGVVHRWSIGDMKRSLLRGLQSKFKITDSGIPLVHPVHHRFSVSDLNQVVYDEPEIQRINRVEERMQMLEMLFKAYYVDDEVFRSLDDANRSGQLRRMTGTRNVPSNNIMNDSSIFQSSHTIVPKTEKIMNHVSNSSSTSINKLVAYPHSFTRHDTDEGSVSNIPLAQQSHQYSPPYQPKTTVQLQDDYI